MYGAVPPVAVTVTVALPPLHKIWVVTVEEAVKAAGCVTMIVVVVVQLFASVTV